jgi:hypothetical protein
VTSSGDGNFAGDLTISGKYYGDGSELTGISTGKWSDCTGGICYSDGDVGIGTVTPGAKLDIADTATAAGAPFLRVGDDSFLTDIDAAGTLGIYGVQDSTQGNIKLGSAGPTLSGASGNLALSGDLTVSGNDIKDSGGNVVISFNGSGVVDAISGNAMTNAEWTQVAGISNTHVGLTGGQGLDTPSTPADWSNLGWLYSTMIHSTVGIDEGAPVDTYGYFLKVAQRDSSGGWAGIWTGYGADSNYFGRTSTNASYATWEKIAMHGTSPTFADLTVSGNAVIAGSYYGAESGAPSSYIWSISPTYPNYGIYYNSGSPDLVQYMWNGTSKIDMGIETGNINISGKYYGDGSELTGISAGKWSDCTGGICYSGGNVGIGTASPLSALHVADSVGGVNIRLSQYATVGRTSSSHALILGDNVMADEGIVNQMMNNVDHSTYAGSAILIQGNDGITFHTKSGSAVAGAVYDSPKVKITSAVNATMNMYASDGDTGTLSYSTSDRWEWSNGSFYLMDSVPTTYIYSANTYLGASSGDTIHTRGNVVNIGENASGRDGDLRIINYTGNAVSDGIKFYEGTTLVGTIGVEDTTWLRINQEVAKNIYTPRYIRAAGGFYVGDDEYIYWGAEDQIRTGDSLVVDGNVGVGVTTPAYKLDVSGNARINGSLILGSGAYIDDDTTLGGNADDWIKLSGYIEMKSNTDSYGIVLRDKDTTSYLGLTQVGGYSYLADSNSYSNYFLRGNGSDVHIKSLLSVGGDISASSNSPSSCSWECAGGEGLSGEFSNICDSGKFAAGIKIKKQYWAFYHGVYNVCVYCCEL